MIIVRMFESYKPSRVRRKQGGRSGLQDLGGQSSCSPDTPCPPRPGTQRGGGGHGRRNVNRNIMYYVAQYIKQDQYSTRKDTLLSEHKYTGQIS